MDIIHFQFCLPTSKKICLLDCLPVGNEYSARDNIYQLVVIDQNLKKHYSSKSNTNLKVSMRATNIEENQSNATNHQKSQSNVTSVILHHQGQGIWGHIWKHTLEKSWTNATSVSMHSFKQAIWGDIWKPSLEKNRTNATSVTMIPLRQAIWGDIWKHTVKKSWTNAANATMHPLRTVF